MPEDGSGCENVFCFQYFFFFYSSKKSLVLISAIEPHSGWYINEEFGFEIFFFKRPK